LLERSSVKPVISDEPPRRAKRSRKTAADEPELLAAK
jgi:hypothetical protein